MTARNRHKIDRNCAAALFSFMKIRKTYVRPLFLEVGFSVRASLRREGPGPGAWGPGPYGLGPHGLGFHMDTLVSRRDPQYDVCVPWYEGRVPCGTTAGSLGARAGCIGTRRGPGSGTGVPVPRDRVTGDHPWGLHRGTACLGCQPIARHAISATRAHAGPR